MSVVKNSKYGWFISHELLIKEIYSKVDVSETSFQFKPELFNILAPYKTTKIKKPKQKAHSQKDPFETEVQHVEDLFKLLYPDIEDVFDEPQLEVRNNDAVETATKVYDDSGQKLSGDFYGANPDGPIIKTFENGDYLFPEKCKFYGKNVTDMSQYLKGEKYDLILLDPPWWNKYIRRKRKHTDHGYDMMYNTELESLPLENLLNDNALVVVWCTNSSQHLSALRDEIFPKWGIKYLGKWYWVKVTKSGLPVCQFAEPPRKQPFEQIIFGCVEERSLPNPPLEKLVVSVPSALHSHKPPLIRLLEPYIPENPNCLEVFARYLLSNWTSYGKEVTRFQHESLYTKISM